MQLPIASQAAAVTILVHDLFMVIASPVLNGKEGISAGCAGVGAQPIRPRSTLAAPLAVGNATVPDYASFASGLDWNFERSLKATTSIEMPNTRA